MKSFSMALKTLSELFMKQLEKEKKVFVIERQLCVDISYIHQSPVFLPF